MPNTNIEKVSERIMAFSPGVRAVLGLYYVEDLTYEEVAQVLEMPVGSVKMIVEGSRQLLLRIAGSRVEGM